MIVSLPAILHPVDPPFDPLLSFCNAVLLTALLLAVAVAAAATARAPAVVVLSILARCFEFALGCLFPRADARNPCTVDVRRLLLLWLLTLLRGLELRDLLPDDGGATLLLPLI